MATTVLGQDQNGNLRALPLDEAAGGGTVIPVIVKSSGNAIKMDIEKFSASMPIIGLDAMAVTAEGELIESVDGSLPWEVQAKIKKFYKAENGVTASDLLIPTNLVRETASFQIELPNISPTATVTIQFTKGLGAADVLDTITLAAPIQTHVVQWSMSIHAQTVAGVTLGQVPPRNLLCDVTASEPVDLVFYGVAR